MTETTPRREATRRRLIEAAISEFAARGIDATSVEQLTEAADFTRGAFYSNFATKDDLCLAIMQQQRDSILASLSQAFDAQPADADVEWAVTEALPQFFSIIGPTDEFRTTVMEIRLRATRSPELKMRLQEFKAETRPKMERFISRLASQVGLRFRVDVADGLEILEAVFFHALLDDLDPSPLLASAALALCDPLPDSSSTSG